MKEKEARDEKKRLEEAEQQATKGGKGAKKGAEVVEQKTEEEDIPEPPQFLYNEF